MPTFGQLLKSYRSRTQTAAGKRLTQTELADALRDELGFQGYSAQTVSYWENDRSLPLTDDVVHGLIAVLYRHHGLMTLDEAQQLLKAGSFRALEDEKIQAIEPNWLSDEAREDVPLPYLGLHPFAERDARFFFGRTLPIQQISTLIQQHPIVTIVGAAGSGKTSLMQAGVVPHLHQLGWHCLTISATNNLFHAVATALLPLTERISHIQQTAKQLESGNLALSTLFSLLPEKLLLIFDDWDQTLPAQRMQLAIMLQTVLPDYPTLRLAFVVRTTEELNEWQAASCEITLTPPSRRELEEIIVNPAAEQKVTVEDLLVTQLLDKLAGSLPLLAIVLHELWKARDGLVLTYALYRQLGELEGMLSAYAEEGMTRFSAENQKVAQSIFLQLIQQSDDENFVQQAVPLRYFNRAETEQAMRLAETRLVTIEQRDDEPFVQIAHAVFITQWLLAQSWFTEDRAFWNLRQQLRGALRQWEANEKQPRALLNGKQLQTAIAIERPLNEVEIAFIQKSIAHQKQRHQRVRQIATAISAVVILVLFVTFHLQRMATARAFLAEARDSLAANEFDEALRQGLQGVEAWDSAESNNALAAIWSENPYLVRYITADGAAFTSFALLPNQQLVAGHADGSLSFWDMTTFQQIATRPSPHNYEVTAIAASDTIFATGGGDGSLALWRFNSERPHIVIDGAHGINILSMAFASDFLATGGDDIRFWRVETGEAMFEPIVGNGLVRGMVFSTDDTLHAVTQNQQWIRWQAETVIVEPLPTVLESIAITGDTIIIGDASGSIIVNPLAPPLPTTLLTVDALQFNEEGQLIAGGCLAHLELSWRCVQGGVAMYDDSDYGEEIRVIDVGLENEVIDLASNENGQLFVLSTQRITVLQDTARPAPVGYDEWERVICVATNCDS